MDINVWLLEFEQEEKEVKRDELLNKLKYIFRDVFGDEELDLSEETCSESIVAWDSLAQISILAAVQDEFKVTFDMEEIVAMNSVKSIIDAIEGKIK